MASEPYELSPVFMVTYMKITYPGFQILKNDTKVDILNHLVTIRLPCNVITNSGELAYYFT